MSDAKASTAPGSAGAVSPTWESHLQAEAAAIEQRRKVACAGDAEARNAPHAGLALSGGGVRSATFCLGLIRGLAQNGILRRFDYVSTVSGGGFVGAALGRLVGSIGIDKAEAQLEASDSLVLAWLRRNGRYLTPSGARDFGMVIATMLRDGASTHFEIGILALLTGLIATMPHVVQTVWPLFDADAWQGWWTCWWPMAFGVWLLLAPGSMIAFWPMRENAAALGRKIPDGVPYRELLVLFAGALAGLLLGALSLHARPSDPTHPLIGPPSIGSVAALVFAGLLGRLASLFLRFHRQRGHDAYDVIAQQRNRLTRSLRRVNQVTATLFALGLLDVVTWQISLHLGDLASPWIAGGVGVGAIIALLLRSVAEPLQKINASADRTSARWLPMLINIGGIVIGLVILAAWVVVLQWLLFAPRPLAAVTFLPPWARAAIVLAGIAAWYLFTIRNRETVNASSLHSFYRARLTRAYISLGNRQRFSDIATANGSTAALDAIASVTDVVPNDDVRLADYGPEAQGGPLHLICACLNQTIDDHGELYNADRKGSAIVASRRGLEVGDRVIPIDEPHIDFGTLGRWIATSGAAAAPGAGSFTTPGWALLLFLAGARLGYWMNAESIRRKDVAQSQRDAFTRALGRLSRWLRETKPGLLGSEALASFGGPTRRWWYLSDGGHFENTGVYALLRREVEFIVLADCGADPDFDFADLENLVRKARIDFDAEIELYNSEEAAKLGIADRGQVAILSPQDMINNQSARGVLMARIVYHRSNPQLHRIGTLLIVKPNLHEALDNDLLAYARRNPAFPQQPTSDQFFDEAQWESYHRLGEDFGRALTSSWLCQLPCWSKPAACPEKVAPLCPSKRPAKKAADDAKPFWRRTPASAAISTTLGLGAIGTLLLPAWTFVDGLNRERADQAAQVAARKNAAKEQLADIEPCLRELLPDETGARCKEGNATVAQKLADVYSASVDFKGDPQMRFVEGLVGDVQHKCGVSAGICPDDIAGKNPLCNAVCRNDIADRPKDPYWNFSPAEDGAWQQNVLVAATLGRYTRWAGTAVLQQTVSSTSAPAPAPPPPPPPPPPPLAEAPPPAPEITAGIDNTRLAGCSDALLGPITVYTQIYDEVMRSGVDQLRTKFDRNGPVRFAGIENVTNTTAQSAKQPTRWREPTLLVHRTADFPCGNAFAEQLGPLLKPLYGSAVSVRVRSLPPSFKSERHVLELWLPPIEMAAAR